MHFFDRNLSAPPKFFRAPQATRARAQLLEYFELSPLMRAQTRFSEHALDLNDSQVLDGLRHLFRGKCAFCEAERETLAYRFRPQASATPEGNDGHLYYTWLANAWDNVYAICRDCIPHQPEYFPVYGNRLPLPDIERLQAYVEEDLGTWRLKPSDEKHALLDPCGDKRFHEHLFVSINGEVKAQSPRGALTISHFKLNREELVRERAEVLSGYRRRLLEPGRGRFHGRELFDFDNLAFGGLWYLQCRLIVDYLSSIVRGRPFIVSRSQISSSFTRLYPHLGSDEHREKLHRWIENNFAPHREDFTLPPTTAQPEPEEKIPGPLPPPPIYPTLRSIELTHFKAISHLELPLVRQSAESLLGRNPGQPAMLILGENATGKSSILEATALALSDEGTRASLRLDIADLVLDPTYLGQMSRPVMPSAQIRLGFEQAPDAVLDIVGAAWKPQIMGVTPPVFAYGAFRQYQKNSSTYKPGPGIFNLFNSERLLPDPEPWLLGLGEHDLAVVARALRFIMAVEGDFEVITKSADEQRCLIVTRAGGVETVTPMSHASSGYRSVLAMVCDIMRRLMDRSTNPHYQSLENARAIVLIDEVEAHLHPRWKIQIMGALRRALPKVTFIATSHDPLCVRGMHHGEVLVVHRTAKPLEEDGKEMMAHVEQLQGLPDITQLTIEQLLTSDFFSLASTDQPLMNLKLGQLADLLAASYSGEELKPDDDAVVQRFKADINHVLPVGSTAAQRMVQEVVAKVLSARIAASEARLESLDAQAKADIRALLEGF